MTSGGGIPRRTMLAALAGWPAVQAWAWAHPGKPIRLIVPFPPGGGADNLARLIMPRVSRLLGRPILIDNRPGAGGNMGAELAARANADGHTVFYGTNGTHAINPHLYRTLRFDPARDFLPVTGMTEIAAMLVVTPGLPVHGTAELIAHARAHPGRINFASAGNGTTSHLASEMFRAMAGIDIVHVPYRGGAPAMTDLMGGQVQMMVEVMPNCLPLVKAGRLRGLAVSTRERFPGAAEYPTIAESGLPGFEASAWDGLFLPAGAPLPVAMQLNDVLHQALAEPDLVEALLARGARPVPSSAATFARRIEASSQRWAEVVRRSHAKID